MKSNHFGEKHPGGDMERDDFNAPGEYAALSEERRQLIQQLQDILTRAQLDEVVVADIQTIIEALEQGVSFESAISLVTDALNEYRTLKGVKSNATTRALEDIHIKIVTCPKEEEISSENRATPKLQ